MMNRLLIGITMFAVAVSAMAEPPYYWRPDKFKSIRLANEGESTAATMNKTWFDKLVSDDGTETITGYYLFTTNQPDFNAGIGFASGAESIAYNAANTEFDFTGPINADTLDTGLGNTELYQMNQNVRTTDAVSHITPFGLSFAAGTDRKRIITINNSSATPVAAVEFDPLNDEWIFYDPGTATDWLTLLGNGQVSLDNGLLHLQPVSTPLATPEGGVYYDSDDDSLYVRNSTAWVPLGGAGALANPSGTINGTASDGTALTAMRSDGAPALADPLTLADDVFQLTRTSNANTVIDLYNPSTGGSAAAQYRLHNAVVTDAGMWLQGSGNVGSVYGGANSLNIYQGGAHPITFNTTNARRMVITAGGSVGIGTDITPAGFFTVGSGEDFQIDSSGNITKTGTGTHQFLGFLRADDGTLGTPTVASAAGDIYGEDVIEAGNDVKAVDDLIAGDDLTVGDDATITDALTVGYVLGGGSAPTIAAGVGAGTAPTVSIAGNSMAGIITVTTGTAPVGGNSIIATITPGITAPNVFCPVIFPNNAAAAALTTGAFSASSAGLPTTTWELTGGVIALAAATTYKWNYYSGVR